MTNLPPDDFDDEFDEYDDFEEDGETYEARPSGRESSPFAPVVFDDDQASRRRSVRPGGEYESDAGLLRVLGIIAVLGIVIIALVLPWSPVSVLGGGDGNGDGDIPAQARDDIPPLPEGLVALSRLYDITVPADLNVPLSVRIELTETTRDASNLALY
ncbi:MAG: hypothetical protein WD058_03620, partial [Dehalococcoidia bacterium]